MDRKKLEKLERFAGEKQRESNPEKSGDQNKSAEPGESLKVSDNSDRSKANRK